jgi:putative tryptophan/tyrosine transport system substrate-binding protein
MADRRTFLGALASAVISAPFSTFAQQQRPVPRVGFLMSETLSAQASRIEALRAGLRDRGYVEGKNIYIQIRSADGNYDRLPALAAELASLKVDVIVAFGTKAVSASKRATTTIPIVDPFMGDPVALGLSSSLARPGGNITGSAQFTPEVGAKRVEFLKEAVPSITRVAALMNPTNESTPQQVQAMRVIASALKLELHTLEVRNAKEIEETFAAIAQKRVEAIVVSSDTLFRANAIEIADRAAKQKLPSIGPKEFASTGGLIGYGPDAVEAYRRAAYFVDRILKGAKPDDLPIEQATKLELVINLKTAKALGVTIPQSLLVRADEVIQ